MCQLNSEQWQSGGIILKQLEDPLQLIIKNVLTAELKNREYCSSIVQSYSKQYILIGFVANEEWHRMQISY